MKRLLLSLVFLTSLAARAAEVPKGMEVATFAGGCFWSIEKVFDLTPGVKTAMSGYMGGHKKNPTYEEVCTGTTGHAESVQVVYDPKQVTYEKLLDVYWRAIDPTNPNGQFVDTGDQYRPVIFYHTLEQKKLAEASKEALGKSKRFKKPIAVTIAPAATFWTAEAYHQDYHKLHHDSYEWYRSHSGRDEFTAEFWSKP
jgi:methionine-S-sulfoxide reductase